MTPSEHNHLPAFSDLTDEQITYRPLCVTAIIALVLGVLSVLSLAAMGFWLVPVAGIILGIVGLVLTDPSIKENRPTGRWAAVVGLSLSLLFLAAGITDHYGYRASINRQACKVADEFLRLLAEDKRKEAFQLTIEPRYRYPLDGGDLGSFYKDGPAWADALAKWETATNLDGEPDAIPRILALGERAQPRLLEVSYNVTQMFGRRVRLVYAIDDRDAPDAPPLLVALQLDRHHMKNDRAYWRVESAMEVQKKGAA